MDSYLIVWRSKIKFVVDIGFMYLLLTDVYFDLIYYSI